jgi:hypothetical protein
MNAMTAMRWASCLCDFAHASPTLVEDRGMQQRAESKFVVSEAKAAAFVLSLRGQFAVLPAGAALVANYRSLYFDTDDLSFFHAHRCGRRVRHKVRIRHYPDRALSVTEVKTRLSERHSAKARRPREYGNSRFDADDLAFARAHCGPIDDLVPQAWVAYRRVTLLGLQSPERVTLDMQLDVWRVTGQGQLRRAIVIEVKQPRLDHRSVAMRQLRAAGCRPGWMSKYCTAIALTSPGVGANHFSSRMRHLKAVGTWTH